jgi:hypothetical protein
VVTAVLAVCLLTGCSTSDGGEDAGSTSSLPVATEGGGTPTAVPTDLRECPGDKGGRTAASVGGYTHTAPAGFTETAGHGQIEDAEGAHDDVYYLLDGADGLEVLALVYYPQLEHGPVTDPCGELDVDAVLERIAQHNEASGSQVTVKPAVTQIDDVPVVTEERSYPQHGMHVRHYWIYSETDLLNIQCQWTSHQDEVLTGCDTLVASLELT